MIEVTGVKVPVASLDGSDETELRAVRAALLHRLRLSPRDLLSVELRRRSIDARRRDAIVVIYTARIQLAGGADAETSLMDRLARRHADGGISLIHETPFSLPAFAGTVVGTRPVVVGAGCAGLFCALALARAGLEPLLVERGDDALRRGRVVSLHNETGILDPECNIQYGVGGAGTFSDGKLQTGTKSVSHRFILETFVEAGAQRRILWDAKPHVGSDVLPGVVTNIVRMIEEAGGEVRCRCRLTDIGVTDGAVRSVTLETRDAKGAPREERVATSCVILSCGHSARDVFELLRDHGISMERKTFAMGVRIEHLQADVDAVLYGRSAGHPALGAAPYKLAVHLPSGRSAFSFCMCPGGFVVSAASEPAGVVTNGMSLSDRAGENANAGLLANVFPGDLPGDDVLAGVRLQRDCEQAAFAAGGGAYVAPAQLVGDFLQGVPSSAGGRVRPTYPRGVAWGDVAPCLPGYVWQTIRDAIPLMERRLRGFSAADAVLTGVETRSSAPVRVTRDDDGQSVSTRGLWPCGEGAGYAGGIMSAAADGIRTAEAVVGALGRTR